MLSKGVHTKELMNKFPNATSDVQMLADVQHYANAYGYDLHYDNNEKVVQLVLPVGMETIKYASAQDVVGEALM